MERGLYYSGGTVALFLLAMAAEVWETRDLRDYTEPISDLTSGLPLRTHSKFVSSFIILRLPSLIGYRF